MRVSRILKVAGIAVLAIGVGGGVVTLLWNALMPGIFGLHTITFWQALGLLILSKVFFGGFRGRGFGGPRMMRRWQQMTPEQREQFMQGMRGRCGRFESPAASEPTPS